MMDTEAMKRINRMMQESHKRMESMFMTVAEQAAAARLEASKHLPRGKHERAGITTNKGRGQSKARRKMAKASRRKHQG